MCYNKQKERCDFMKAILVALNLKSEIYDLKYSLDELNNLATGLGYIVCNTLTQNLAKPTPNFYIGKGKVEELKIMRDYHEANTIIFNDELSPSQIRNLSEELDCEITDRSLLILNIFDKRATTREAKLEIKLARNKYLLPRATSLFQEDSREGGASGSLSSKGAGETKRELNRRHLTAEIIKLEEEIALLHKMKAQQIEKRKRNQIPVVALVGYTNAGKSSTMNTILNYLSPENTKEVYEKNELFATLNTFNRKVSYKNTDFLLVDTIGFVSKLPHNLIHSFKGTLQEIKNADYIIHVVDISSRYFQEQINVTNAVLAEIGVKEIPTIYLLNKYDLYDDQDTYIVGIDNLPFSNKSNLNLEHLLEKIYENIKPSTIHTEFIIPYHEAKLLHFIEENSQIIRKDYQDNGVYFELILSLSNFEKIQMYELDSIVS